MMCSTAYETGPHQLFYISAPRGHHPLATFSDLQIHGISLNRLEAIVTLAPCTRVEYVMDWMAAAGTANRRDMATSCRIRPMGGLRESRSCGFGDVYSEVCLATTRGLDPV